MNKQNPAFVGDLIPSIINYQKIIDRYEKGIRDGEFYEEPIGDDLIYPDW